MYAYPAIIVLILMKKTNIFKNDLKQFFTLNNLLYFLAVGVAFFVAWKTVIVIQENYALQKKVDALKDKVAILELENEKLVFNNEYYRTDSYLELAARDKFNKKAPGERVIYVPRYELQEEDVTAVPEDNTSDDKSEREKNIEQWLYFLFGKEPS